MSAQICRCFVPNCKNSSRHTPDIKFFKVPYSCERMSWFEAVGKPVYYDLNRNSTLYCCEAHFNMDSAMVIENKNGKTVYKIKPGILPDIYIPKPDLSKSLQHQILQEDLNTKSTQTENTIHNAKEGELSYLPQCNIKEEYFDEAYSIKIEPEKLQTVMPSGLAYFEETVFVNPPEQLQTVTPEGLSSHFEEIVTNSAGSVVSTTLSIMHRRPRHYMGIDNNSVHVISHLTKKTKLSEENIMLTLRKIRLNEAFQTLADLFDIEKVNTAEDYFNNSVIVLSSYLKNFMKYVTPKIKLTKQLSTICIHIQRHSGIKEFDMKSPHLTLDSNLEIKIHFVVQIICGLANLKLKSPKNS